MSKFLTPQLARRAAGLVVVSAFGAAPMLAQAASTDASGNPASAGPTALLGTIRPQGSATIDIDRTVKFTAAKAAKLARETPPADALRTRARMDVDRAEHRGGRCDLADARRLEARPTLCEINRLIPE
jgi:hypothetical protein